jgi:hypothetical protein
MVKPFSRTRNLPDSPRVLRSTHHQLTTPEPGRQPLGCSYRLSTSKAVTGGVGSQGREADYVATTAR